MLLDYALLTAPTPLQAGSPAILTLVISNGSRQKVTVTNIVIALPIGTNARDLTASTGFQSSTSSGWNVAQSSGVLTLTPTDSGVVGAYGVTVTIANVAVNDQPGIANISISETAAVGGGSPTTNSTSLPAAKFPVQFAVSDLTVTPTQVAFGGSVAVNWTGTQAEAATYTLDWPDAPTHPVSVSNVGPYQASNLATFPEVFTLTVSLTVPGQDQKVTVQRQAIVVQAAELKIQSFGSDRASVGGTDSFHLLWQVQQATSLTLGTSLIPGSAITVTGQSRCTVSPQGNNLIVSDQSGNKLGTLAVPGSPLELPFTLTASDGTLNVQASASVTVLPPTIDKNECHYMGYDGEHVTYQLTWATHHASSCVIQPWPGGVPTSGQQTLQVVLPNDSPPTVILTATGYLGLTKSQTATMT